jgi:PAS domain S-box-containing protein
MQTRHRALPKSSVIFVLLLTMATLVAIGVFSWASTRAHDAADAQLRRARQVVNSTSELLSALKDAETGQRGFVITGAEDYLAPYNTALANLPAIRARLRAALAGEPWLNNLPNLNSLVDAKIAELAKTIDLRRTAGFDGARQVVVTNEGRDLMEGIRAQCAAIVEASDREVAGALAIANAQESRLAFIVFGGGTLLLAISVLATIVILSSLVQREKLFNEASATAELLQVTLSSLGDAVISTDAGARIRMINPAAEKLTGWSSADAIGKPIVEVFRIVKEGTGTPAEIPIDRILRTGKVIGLANHTELIGKTGGRIPIDDSGAPIRSREGKIMGAVLVFRDIVERREAERALVASERRAREILDSIRDARVILDGQWRFKELNPAAEKILNVSAADLLDRDHWEAYPALVGTPLEAAYRKAAADNVPAHLEYFYPAGERWLDVRAYPSSLGLTIYLRDITERKLSEAALLRLNDDLRHFTYAATHDVREPLRMITIGIQMFRRHSGGNLDSGANELLDQIDNGAQRISRLIDGLLQFSRAGDIPADPASADAEAALKEAIGNVEMSIRDEQAKITNDPLPAVAADSVHLTQLFQNLLSNALKYGRLGVPPEVHVSAKREGADCVFSVRDNGIGIAPQYHARIFEPFRRLHGSEIAGAGVGLATCKRIVERHGGRIWVESEPGNGAIFFFSLPASRELQKQG